MKPIYEMKLIQIEVTNACHLKCANCTRFVGHHKNSYYMDLDTVRKAIDSLEGYKGNIGLMGGEPALHPRFEEICEIFQEMIPDKKRRQLWTSGFKWDKHKSVIKNTFYDSHIAYNPHQASDGFHQPLLIAAKDLIDNDFLMWHLIDNCWVQNRWSASITPNGCFFCEVAAAMDYLFDKEGGFPIEKGWWKKEPVDFMDQVIKYCPHCGGAVPFLRPSDKEKYDLVSKSNAIRLKKVESPKFLKGNVIIYDKEYSIKDYKLFRDGWQPQNYRTFIAHNPEEYKAEKK